MKMPPEVRETIQRMFSQFAKLPWESDQARRNWIKMVAEQLHAFYGSSWGTKSTTKNHPQSADAICQLQPDQRLFVWDVINGTTGMLMFPDSKDITGHHFIRYAPKNHLSGSGEVPTPPTPPPTLSLEQKVDLLIETNSRILDLLGSLPSIQHESLQTGLRTLRIENNQYQDATVEMRIPTFGGTARGVIKGVLKPEIR